MNNIVAREGPHLEFITDKYKSEFEQNIISIYVKSNQATKYQAPIITDDIFFNRELNPIHFASAYLKKKTDEPDRFEKETKDMTQEEVFSHALQVVNNFEVSGYREAIFDQLMYMDIQSVLEYNKMCYVDVESTLGYGINQGIFYRNMPIRQVW